MWESSEVTGWEVPGFVRGWGTKLWCNTSRKWNVSRFLYRDLILYTYNINTQLSNGYRNWIQDRRPGFVSWEGKVLMNFSIFLRVLMKKYVWGTGRRGSMVKCGGTSLEGEGHIKSPWDALCKMVLWKLLNTCGWIFGAWLLLQLKSRSAIGASHHPPCLDNCRIINHTFYSPI